MLENSGSSRLIALIMKYSGGRIEDEKTAGYVALGVVAVMIMISLVLVVSGGSSDYEKKVIPSTPAAGVDDPNFRR